MPRPNRAVPCCRVGIATATGLSAKNIKSQTSWLRMSARWEVRVDVTGTHDSSQSASERAVPQKHVRLTGVGALRAKVAGSAWSITPRVRQSVRAPIPARWAAILSPTHTVGATGAGQCVHACVWPRANSVRPWGGDERKATATWAVHTDVATGMLGVRRGVAVAEVPEHGERVGKSSYY
jgi:hypothetical protein